MIDIHNHMLPGIDDGSQDMETTLEMARIAVESGIKVVAVTPHCNIPGAPQNYFDKNYVRKFKEVQNALRMAEIPLKILPGMEVFVTFDLPELIKAKKIMTLNQSRYLLVEFAFSEDLEFADDMLRRISELGLIPVIAHAERYHFVQENPEVTYEWCQKGYVIQVNKSSVRGSFGKSAQHMAYRMLDKGRVSVIASDAHGIEYRTPYMKDIYRMLQERYEEAYLDVLFRKNPVNICRNLPIIR